MEIQRQRRRVLEMLADEPGGCDEEELSAHHEFETLAGLVRDGPVTAHLETMRAGSQTIEVTRTKITDEGWKALISPDHLLPGAGADGDPR
jgi:hypothetical protein